MPAFTRRRSGIRSFSLFAPLLFASAIAQLAPARSQQGKPAARPKTQKLANPLNDLLNDAQAALDKNDFAAAISPLQKFLAEEPDVAYAHFQLAYAYTGLHQDDGARAEYAKCIALDPKMA